MTQLTLDGQPAKKRAKNASKGKTFLSQHTDQYGLKVSSVNAATSLVETVSCRFCFSFGREVGPTVLKATGKTRAAVTTKKMWATGQFRCDLYAKHLESQHPTKWAEYQALTAEDKANFFNALNVPYAQTLPASFEGERSLEFVMAAPIVDTILGDLLFHPDDVSQQSEARERALAVFKLDGTTGQYHVTVKHPSRFRLTVRFMGRGASFRMVSGLMDDVREETEIGRYGGCGEQVAARYARIICGVSLQRLSDVIPTAWAMSIALDSATHQGRSYVDIRCRFSVNARLHNFHLLAIPLHTRHTGEHIFDLARRFLDGLLPKWRSQILGVSTDDAATMIGSVKGVATRIETEATYELTRVWCGLHQLDLKMQIIFELALDGKYLDKLYAVIGYLRRQYNLISDMQSTCPKVSDTRWLSMYSVVNWLCNHGFEVREYMTKNKATCDPNIVWWIFLFAMKEVAKEANAVFVSLQGLSTLVEQQHSRFVGLLSRLRDMSGVEGPLSSDKIEAQDEETHQHAGAFVISHAAALSYTQNLGVWVCENLLKLSSDQLSYLVRAIARLMVVACSNIHALTQGPIAIVPVTPKTLTTTSTPAFTQLIAKYRQQLLPFVGESGIYKIGEEFKALRDSYRTGTAFQQALDAFDGPLASFDDHWAVCGAGVRYPLLAYFCGGLASVFPNTATVESDFSLIGCEKNDKRTGLTDLALEGVLHCKQWNSLVDLAQQ